jgi:hypothetical protein
MSPRETHLNSGRKSENIKTIKYLIISEDSKSFVIYFREILLQKPYDFKNLKKYYPKEKLSIEVEIKSKDNKHRSLSCPLNNLNFAIENIEKYQKIYCVFDYSKSEKYKEAIANAKKYRDKVEIIDSNPSFEYWLFLHFSNSTKPFKDQHQLIKELEELFNSKLKADNKKSKKIFKYDKGKYDDDFIKLLINNHDKAIKFAKKNFEKTSNNPLTKIYKLFDDIRNFN